LFSLVHNYGFQNTKRHSQWREILKAPLIELEEIEVFKKNGNDYRENETIFTQFEKQIYKFDSVSFRQVDEDVSAF
jgi:hypothetical protein